MAAPDKCKMVLPHRVQQEIAGSRTDGNADLVRLAQNFDSIQRWADHLLTEPNCLLSQIPSVISLTFGWPGILSETSTAIWKATAGFRFTTVQLTAEEHGTSGDIDVALQTKLDGAGSWTTFDTYTLGTTTTDMTVATIELTVAQGDKIRCSCTDGSDVNAVDVTLTLGGRTT